MTRSVKSPPRLHELAFACRIYGVLSRYDYSLTKLRKATGGKLDPHNPHHQDVLFNWLNDWGCRQFSKAHHATVAAPSLVTWANRWLPLLPPDHVPLKAIDKVQIDQIGRAHVELRRRLAGTRTLENGTVSKVEYGPVGAAKTLFALRPSLCAPWDAFTLSRLGFDRSGASYGEYLEFVLSQLRALAMQAGVDIDELPSLVGRPESTPPKLIDEYYWVTITRGFVAPTREDLATWIAWADL